MRGVVVFALAVLALAASAPLQAGSAGATSLRISFWEDGSLAERPDSVLTLRCNPARGTLAQPARACVRLAAGGAKLVTPVPESAICTEIWGGPQRARVVGTIAGKKVWATFSRANGCHIDRWNKLAPWLIPAGGVPR
jgi:hypothetical protein